jgi:hypothetical protein
MRCRSENILIEPTVTRGILQNVDKNPTLNLLFLNGKSCDILFYVNFEMENKNHG